MPYLLYIEERVIDKNTYFLLEKSGRVSFFEKIKQPHAHTSLFLYSYCFIGCPPMSEIFLFLNYHSVLPLSFFCSVRMLCVSRSFRAFMRLPLSFILPVVRALAVLISPVMVLTKKS